jgi:DNA-binding PadR family transcriptional regulator
VSSIRLFVLGSLAQRGPMHGHALILLAEEEHIDQWTDFAPSAIYSAIKRLAVEGLLLPHRVEKQGNYPERQIYRVSADGLEALDELRAQALFEVAMKPDPVDLALARLDPHKLDDLSDVIGDRLARLQARLTEHSSRLTEIHQYLSVAETLSFRHREFRLQAEINWHNQILSELPQLIHDERTRKAN